MNITIAVKDQYGQKTLVPVCDIAKTFAAIAGTKTLTFDTLNRIKSLGYTVAVQQTTI